MPDLFLKVGLILHLLLLFLKIIFPRIALFTHSLRHKLSFVHILREAFPKSYLLLIHPQEFFFVDRQVLIFLPQLRYLFLQCFTLTQQLRNCSHFALVINGICDAVFDEINTFSHMEVGGFCQCLIVWTAERAFLDFGTNRLTQVHANK